MDAGWKGFCSGGQRAQLTGILSNGIDESWNPSSFRLVADAGSPPVS
jgi:hypothetical protein